MVVAGLFLGPAVSGAGAANLSGVADAGPLAQTRSSGVNARVARPCSDRAHNVFGRWSETFHWSFDASSTPAALNGTAVEAVIRRSFSNITRARNDCGRADHVGARHVYDGRTTRPANISRHATCTRPDGHNVVAFGRLPAGILAVTCTRLRHGSIVEADMRINSRYRWALSAAKCSGQELIEPTVTHEAGHVFGLGHVGERRHPLLTMSTASDGPCSDDASTLGLGDMLGLEELY